MYFHKVISRKTYFNILKGKNVQKKLIIKKNCVQFLPGRRRVRPQDAWSLPEDLTFQTSDPESLFLDARGSEDQNP
jgi:hypothetical protein